MEKCQHKELQFGSGDYYLFCHNCRGMWMRGSYDRPEYGDDKDGKKIGAAPELANQGFEGGNEQIRVMPPVPHNWFIFHGAECCKDCGVVRRKDDNNASCKGKVKLRPLEKPLTEAKHG